MSWIEDEDQKVLNTEQKSNEEALLDPNKQIWSLLEKTINENLIEKRRARRWKIFFRSITLSIMISVVVGWFIQSHIPDVNVDGEVVAVIPMRGVIGADQDIESYEFISLLDNVYRNSELVGVVIEMNSPGGSPVHSGIIYDAIEFKRQAYPNIPIVVVVEDMAASGGYYIASAASEIYADKASLVGSIGVISSGFDASSLLEKIGVERRTFTAGRNKAFLDPFAPMTKEAEQKWQAVLDETHQQFINAVKKGRGDRLIITDDIFSGMVFTGSQAMKTGLIDGLSNTNELLNRRFPTASPIVYTLKEESWKELAREFGVEITTKIMNSNIIQ